MREKITKILIAFFTIFLIISTSYIGYNLYQSNKQKEQIEELRKSKVENPETVDVVKEQLEEEAEVLETQDNKMQTILPEYEELYNENTDLIGWIKIEDTLIDYPVMQTFEDPIFYTYRDWNKNESSCGLPLIDARCTLKSENIIIYAHRMKDGTMFGSLKNYSNKEGKKFYDKHKIIKFDTIYEKSEYQIIAVLFAKVYYNEKPDESKFVYYDYIELDAEEKFQEYINQIKERSIYDTGVTAEYGDSLITLCTCDYNEEDGRLLVVAKKIQ